MNLTPGLRQKKGTQQIGKGAPRETLSPSGRAGGRTAIHQSPQTLLYISQSPHCSHILKPWSFLSAISNSRGVPETEAESVLPSTLGIVDAQPV